MRAWSHGRRVERQRFDYGAPIAKIDTRPMVFVAMFVALIFLLAASQIRTHAVLIDLPQGNPLPPGSYEPAPHALLEISDKNEVFVDGVLLDQGEVTSAINRKRMERPIVVVRPHPNASYAIVALLLRDLTQAGISSSDICFDGLADHRIFQKASVLIDPFDACTLVLIDYRNPVI